MKLSVVVLSEDIRVSIGDQDHWLKVDRYRFWQREELAGWLRELLDLAVESAHQEFVEERGEQDE